MDSELKKLKSSLHRQTYREAKKEMAFRYKKYATYCQVLASSDNDEIRKVYEFFEKDATAYMAPTILSFTRYKFTPYTFKDKTLDFIFGDSLIGVAGDVMNASILHAIRILLDRTSLYMRMAYPNEQISDKIGTIEGKDNSVMKFVNNKLKEGNDLTEVERTFFKYMLDEYDIWFHKVVQVDNKTKHNLSTYDLYEVGDIMQPVILPSAKGYYNNKELKDEKEIPVDFESKYISRAYDLFDKTLEFTTSIIMKSQG